MANQDDRPVGAGSTRTVELQKKSAKGWAEQYGGLILLIIVLSVISFVILYESFVY